MERKEFLKYLGVGSGIVAFTPVLLACNSEVKEGFVMPQNAFTQPLHFPEEIRANDFDLVAESTQKTLAGDAPSDIFTLNGALPSPTIRIKRGQLLNINFQNRIAQE